VAIAPVLHGRGRSVCGKEGAWLATGCRVAVVGVGAMGSALVEGLLAVPGARPELFAVADKVAERLDRWRAVGVRVTRHAEEAVAEAEVVILAVKPKDAADAVAAVRSAVGDGAVVVSVLAGVPMGQLGAGLGRTIALVRAMPNLAVAVRRGITALSTSEEVSREARGRVEDLLRGLGEVCWVPEEALDVITALSGSGPAYVYLFLEGLATAGEALGLDPALSRRLAVETTLGAATLARLHPVEFRALRAAVTSPNGTTAAALRVLEGARFLDTMGAAVAAAARRAAELAVESARTWRMDRKDA
jgi:pyrroline-5-carboxylate reductase